MSWPEVKQAEEEGRYELVLTGESVSERIEKDGLDMGIFKLAALNFLEVTNTRLKILPEEIGQLEHLKTLDMHKNKITNVPQSIARLKDLKYLDLSANDIEELPDELGGLQNIQTLNVNYNKLGSVPSLGRMTSLGKLDVSHNQLTELPEGIFELPHLADVQASNNRISRIGADISKMPVLKVLDLSENEISVVPVELSECPKLKDLSLLGNCIKDSRLAKMIKQCSTKAVLEHVAGMGEPKGSKGKKGGKKGRSKTTSEGDKDGHTTGDARPGITVVYSSSLKVIVQAAVLDVRPFIVCAVMKNVDLTDPAVFKKFITIQTKLHESVCDHRTVATIATHSLAALQLPLLYDAAPPSEVQLVPLGRHKDVTAEKLVTDLRTEALKQKQNSKSKRNPFKSGLYKFLTLVEGASSVAFVRDSAEVTISLPPVTNSENSKIKAGGVLDIFVEVTSSVDLSSCKKVLDALIEKSIEGGLSSISEQEAPEGAKLQQELVIEQVRVVDDQGQVKVAYPSRVDLQFESVKVAFKESKET